MQHRKGSTSPKRRVCPDNIITSFCSPEDAYMKKIWKRLSKEKTMDNMRKVLQNDQECHKHQEEVKEKLSSLIDESNGSSDSMTYQKLFSELAGIDYSQAYDQDLETLIRLAVAKKMESISQETKDNLFSKWDTVVDKDYKRGQT